ncbi:amidohydrolase family protein [Microbacterium sp. Se5.02b]|uniref:amidohydrolase family protein n=1 Tax=Microbacterium sp. Se5.02b TaxID=2864103 RepID=UPI0037CC5F29
MKIFADGIPPLATAWVEEPYADGTTGALLTRGGADPLSAFQRMVELAATRGMQIAVHATGDRSIAEFLAVLEHLRDAPAPAGPHYVVHGDLATPEQIARMREVDAGFAVQPLIAAHTHSWAAVQLGEARLATAWPLAEMLTSGTLTTVTSDAPIASPDWRRGLDAALALLTDAGVVDDAETRRRLLRTMTVDAARQDGASAWKGSLALGKVADLTVLDEDPLTPGRAFSSLGVDRTIVDGRTVFSRD